MIVAKTFETYHLDTETGLTCYKNTRDEIYFSCGSPLETTKEYPPQYNGFTILDLDDAKALIIELQCLVKQLENNLL